MGSVRELAVKMLYNRRKNSHLKRFIACFMAVVVFTTTYALVLPAATLSTPLCGLEEHEHSQACYEEAANRLICSTESLNTHEHTEDCYDGDGNVICGYADFVVHTHDENCYDAEGELVCLLPEIPEHVHTEDCYAGVQGQTDESGNVTEANTDVKAKNLPEAEAALSGNESELSGTADSQTGAESNLHETADSQAGAESDLSGTTDSRTNAESDLSETGGKSETKSDSAGLICDKKQVELHTHSDECYTDGVLTCGKLEVKEHTHTDVCFAQDAEQRLICGKQEHTHTAACYTENAGEVDAIAASDVAAENASEDGTVQGLTPNGTVINVFDYWLSERNSKNSQGDFGEGNQPNWGINKDHALKFTTTWNHAGPNKWTESDSPWKGIVENKLVDRYPMLTKNAVEHSGVDNAKVESLKYLFDPNTKNPYREDFCNVGGLLQVDKTGYYYYDCQKNFAELNEQTGQFTLYDKCGIKIHKTNLEGQFFPFNKFAESAKNESTSKEINHYFGMTLTSRFVQRYGGHTDSSQNKETIFEFSGDDDVWVFIDDVLVGDIGGNHNKASFSINFFTGDVTVNGKVTTNLKQAFTNAGVTLQDTQWSGNTFADDTYHTLKFFYLERGNYDSNMALKYNLTAVPTTGIFKVNQYGERIPGVEFSVYQANENWNYSETDDNRKYVGITDANGEMAFVDEDGMPYTLEELKTKFGQYCVLKETGARKGYRLTCREIRLEITDKVMLCRNTYDSGAWSTATLHVSAPGTLQLMNGEEQLYYNNGDSGTVEQYGTLFAVVFKRRDGESLGEQTSWDPVSGDSTNGYIINTVNAGENLVEKAIETAKTQENHKKNVVFSMAASGAMELSTENLPGDITEYYHMLGETEKEKTKYSIAYYWTKANSLDGATADNTYRVDPDANGNTFERKYGATIEVPNLSNRLIVQKFDKFNNSDKTEESRINGAKFALYRANIDGSYYADNGKSVTLTQDEYTIRTETGAITGKYTMDEETGVITCGSDAVITPVETQVTGSDNGRVKEDGTAIFGIDKPLEIGCYYVREIAAPAGYKLNPTQIMARVTEECIFANAGTADDDVRVARGPGIISSTLHKAASEGNVDNTLTWVYEKLRVSPESKSFEEMDGQKIETWPYLQESGQDLVTYLKYNANDSEEQKSFNYEVNGERYPQGTDTSKIRRRLYTDTGWSDYELYQDYEYGKKEAEKNGAQYTKLTDENAEGEETPRDIANLFSRSTYIQVADPKVSNLEISKTVDDKTESPEEKSFLFHVELSDNQGTALTESYPYTVYDVIYDENGNETERRKASGDAASGTIGTGGTLSLKHHQTVVIRDLPYDARYTVTEAKEIDYETKVQIDGGEPESSNEVKDKELRWDVDEATGKVNNTSCVAYTNTRIPEEPEFSNLEISKTVVDVADASKSKLFSFTVKLSLNGTALTDYYPYTVYDVTYDADGREESRTEVTGQAGHGTIGNGGILSLKHHQTAVITNLPCGAEYTVTESEEDEYLTSVRVDDGEPERSNTASGTLPLAENENRTSRVAYINTKAYVLPGTGGIGDFLPYIIGSILFLCAGIFWLVKRRTFRKSSIAK